MIPAKEYLQQVRKLETMIRNKEAEKQQWKAIAHGVSSFTTGEKVQTSGNPHKMADAISKYIDIEREIDAKIDELVDKRNEIIGVIEQLPEASYDILHKIYIQGMTLDEVAYARGKSRSWAASLHGTALKHLQDILYNVERC